MSYPIYTREQLEAEIKRVRRSIIGKVIVIFLITLSLVAVLGHAADKALALQPAVEKCKGGSHAATSSASRAIPRSQ